MQFMAPRYMRGAFFAYFCRILRIGKNFSEGFITAILRAGYCDFVRLASFRLLVM